MKNNIQEVKEHYNENPRIEWDRLQKSIHMKNTSL